MAITFLQTFPEEIGHLLDAVECFSALYRELHSAEELPPEEILAHNQMVAAADLVHKMYEQRVARRLFEGVPCDN